MIALLLIAAAAGQELFASPAVRCNECHEKMVKEWKTSAHARAFKSPIYTAMRAHAEKAGLSAAKQCDRCHAPLAAFVGVPKGTVEEGVTCDVCHTLKAVEPIPAGAALALEVNDNVKYGPLCDAKAHYFHKMGCSPLHKTATLCGGCHLYYHEVGAGRTVPVLTEYEEWRNETAHSKDAAPCRACHMPYATAEVAKGSAKRKNVPHHGLLGPKGDLFQEAVSLVVKLSEAGDALQVETELTNDGAAHAVPAGLPGRRLILRARSLDADGAVLDRKEIEYGRIHKDATGAEVPFFLAVTTEDRRLRPDVTDKQKLTLARKAAGTVEISLIRRALSTRLAERLGVSAEEQVLIQKSIPHAAKRGLPKTVQLSKDKP